MRGSATVLTQRGVGASILLVACFAAPCQRAQGGSPPDLPNGILVKSVREDGLNGDFFVKPLGKPQKALLLLGGSEGGKSWSEHPTDVHQLVDQGYCVLSLAYFGVEGLPGVQRAIPLEYFARALHWLSLQKEVLPNGYAVMGVSRGAELALLLGSRYPEIRTVIAIAPSSVVFPGPPTGIWDAVRGQHSAWSSGGQEVPFVPIPYSWTSLRGMITGERTRMFEMALRNQRAVEAAGIPVERIQGPILLVSFTRDQVWPSTPMSNQLMRRLREGGFRFRYEHAAYDTTHSNWSIAPCWTNILGFLASTRTSAPPGN
jgi:pimeloyl-ACP methyl ester carboxylesterase